MLPLLTPASPTGVRAVFTTRAGGASLPPYAELNLGDHVGDDPGTVRENRARAAAALGLAADRLVFAEQVHGVCVALLDGPVAVAPIADALVTRTFDLALVVMVADCVPVLLADPEAAVVACAHAGRKGVAAGVVPAAVQAMLDCGARPEAITAWLGPAIDGCCYAVPADMAAEVADAAPGTVTYGGRTRTGEFGLDLRDGVTAQLAALGVERVMRVGGCANDDPDFFSYRRDGTTGRFAGLVWLTGARDARS
jgi:hypothetical protein